jgi:hypothetical protein
VSLRNNAERLLRDVQLTHGGMTARLDQIGPAPKPKRATSTSENPSAGRRRAPRKERADDDLDVPEFIPRG